MFIELQVTNNGETILVNPANITYVEKYDGSGVTQSYNAVVHFSNTSKKVINKKDTVERRVDAMREEMMEGMVPDISDMGGMF